VAERAVRFPDRVRSADDAFLDPALEGRRLFAEAWGTFLLVVVDAGAVAVSGYSKGAISPAMRAVAPGLMLTAVIYFMGTVSGAHLNPAVTLAFAARRNFPWRRVPGYLGAQLFGAVLAAFVIRLMFGMAGRVGATVPGAGVSLWQALAMEILLTTGLVSTTLGTVSGAYNIGHNGALARGGYLALAGLWAAPISGASMNPVRSIAPDLVRWDLGTTWIYVAGPLVGAMIAVVFERILKGGPTPTGTATAMGDGGGGDGGGGDGGR
jgi:aquaporin Z